MSDGWCTIESDPGVFTELIENMGVKDVQVEEIYALDDAVTLSNLKPVFGLIFLFKFEGKQYAVPHEISDNSEIFFAKQVIQNACATQAILSILMNAKEVDIGKELNDFKEFTKDHPPDVKGDTIGNCESIKRAHNSFARPESFEFSSKGGKKEDAFHFISYIPFEGKLYELDGLREGPICHGDCNDEDWLENASSIVQKRVQAYASNEIRFSLMALIKNRQTILNSQNTYLENKKKAVLLKLSQMDTSIGSDSAMEIETQFNIPTTREELDILLIEIDSHLETIKLNLMSEEEKRKSWKEENVRRKHNYIPFIINLLRMMAEKQELKKLINKAKDMDSQKIKK